MPGSNDQNDFVSSLVSRRWTKSENAALRGLLRRMVVGVGVVVLVVALLALNAFAASMGYGSF